MNLTNALAYSNNTYFQQVGGQVGFEKMISYARRLGLGEKTGINAPNETQGQLPNLRSGYAVNHMSSHGDDFKVTALQLATLVSAMANGGRLITPRVVRTPQELSRFKPVIRRSINMNLETLRYMVPGMVGAVNYGSGRRAHDPQATVAGKTGTCIENGSWVGLFTSYAPLANPKLAVVVIARGADAHSHFPAAVAGRIYRELNGRFGTPTDLQVAAAQPNVKDEKNSLDEEDEADAADTEDVTDSQPTRAPSATRNKLETSMTPVTKPAIVQTHPLVKSSPSNENVRRVLMPITIKDNKAADVPRPLTRPRRVTEQ
jgi:membrane peptidoglycan carboxypeptidase